MNYRDFENLINNLLEENNFRKEMYLLGYEKYYNNKDFFYEMVDILIRKSFGKLGIDLIYWFIYVKNPNPLHNIIYDDVVGFIECNDIETLYNYLCYLNIKDNER